MENNQIPSSPKVNYNKPTGQSTGKVISGSAVIQKKDSDDKNKTLAMIFKGDAKDALLDVAENIILTHAKAAIVDGVTRFFRYWLFGSSGAGTTKTEYDKVSYNKPTVFANARPTSSSVLHSMDIELASKEDAVALLNAMKRRLSTSAYVSLAETYDMVGRIPTTTDSYYGWRNIDEAEIVSSYKDGKEIFSLHLPKPIVIPVR